MELGLIYARSRNGVIGKDNQLPWRLPEDMAHFKAVTMGCPVLMGRKTWDSLPPRFRPLPGRRNIVITRQPRWSAPGAERAESLEQAIALCANEAQVWVTGGAEIYRLALPIAQRVEVTLVDGDFEGDAYAPELGRDWAEATRQDHVSAAGQRYSFITYLRRRA
ncbi:dihydrofolate reductase [Ramlibacter henchirensis]|uniref:Dihydrofolate reductase n=1 Tax=Ramlibacter henchirensis TaxID=204072 RepID=A0A4Z0C4J4_9BURK|nr:dihydrofolate reductase [Ramlibacter henchirensis]TFZ05824.1 dihydrofolate reductase [Ramlibacter henchirensis]